MNDWKHLIYSDAELDRQRRQNEREEHWCAVATCFMTCLVLWLAVLS